MKFAGKIGFLFVQMLSLPNLATAQSGIKVNDDWAHARTIVLQGEEWTARLKQGFEGIRLLSGENEIRISPGSQSEDRSWRLGTAEIEETDEEGSVTLELRFVSTGSEIEGKFRFEPDGSFQVLPGPGLTNLAVSGELSYGVLPGLYLDDVIYDPGDYPARHVIHIPSENLFWTLLGDETGILVFAWPQGQQQVRLVKDGESFSQLEFMPDGKPVYLQLQAAPCIWHKEQLKLQYLETNVEIEWQRPFDAQWKTQLLVSNVPTTWLFEQESVRLWRPILGFFQYPVWFDGNVTMLHLSKKIPPKGQAFIYPLAGHPKTPLGFAGRTPVAALIDNRRKRIRVNKDHSDRVPNVGYVHCWGTSIMQRTIYNYGLQARERELLNEHIDYCVDYVNRIQQQSLEFYKFIGQMKDQLALWAKESSGHCGVLDFLEQMQRELAKVEEIYHSRVERGGRKTPEEHMAYAERLSRHLKELIQDAGRESYPETKFILDTFNALAAATDEDVPAGFGIAIRRMFQEAGSACTNTQEAVRYAEEIRRRIWQKTETRNYETTGL